MYIKKVYYEAKTHKKFNYRNTNTMEDDCLGERDALKQYRRYNCDDEGEKQDQLNVFLALMDKTNTFIRLD